MGNSLGCGLRGCVGLGLLALLMSCGQVHAWWDTQNIVKSRLFKLVAEVEAESVPGVPAQLLVDDPQGDGGQGSQAFVLRPGGVALAVDFKGLRPRGVYGLYLIVRNGEGPPGITVLTFEVKEAATGQVTTWTVPVTFSSLYFPSARLYFPTAAGGDYRVRVAMAAEGAVVPYESAKPDWVRKHGFKQADGVATGYLARVSATPYGSLWIDRLELRDLFGEIACKAVKQRRALVSDAELAALREEFAGEVAAAIAAKKRLNVNTIEGGVNVAHNRVDWWAEGRPEVERRQRNEMLWSVAPDFNYIYSVNNPRYEVMLRGSAEAAAAYEKTGHPEFGWDAAVMLAAVTWRWPTLDFRVHNIDQTGQGAANPDNIRTNLLTFSDSNGKFVYRGWSGTTAIGLIESYDKIFDFIKDNRALADEIGKRIPWVKEPADVVWLFDVYLLQASMDQAKRDWISSDRVKALIPLVQGVSSVSDRMLDESLFTMLSQNMTFRGGIDDQAACSYSRDGVHYIGSVGYINNTLQEIGEVLQKYVAAGGEKRFDIFDSPDCPQMRESEATVASLNNVAGGFPLIVGDARDLRVGRKVDGLYLPSRLLGGFAATILESGSVSDPLARRAVALYAGIGRGHSHQDTLNIELFAHGSRMMPDLGGRHEGKHHGSPNMRDNRVHNLVEVDDRNFANIYPGSTTSGTGWNTAFSPRPGSQYMEHRARATSHPHVALYQRQTALIDVGDSDSYLFDLFAVAGGSLHTYCFHGGRALDDDFAVNAPLAEAAAADALEYLRKHHDGTRREGRAPAVLRADWPLDPQLQKSYQREAYDPARRPVTRLHLLGREGDRLYVGNAYSEMYQYNFPFLYVRSAAQREEGGLVSLYPAVIEPFAGASFVKEVRLLDGKAAAGAVAAAIEVRLAGGATDKLLAGDGKLFTGAGLASDGRFAHVRHDAAGTMALVHLVGGQRLTAVGVEITLPRPRHEGVITRVDYPGRTFTVDGVWPAAMLDQEAVLIENESHHETFIVERATAGAGSTTVKHEKTALYYQSAIIAMDEAAGWIESEIEPPVFGCDTSFINGTTIANESLSKLWRTSFEESDRWMHIGFPGTRGSLPNKISWDDVPDADGDGRRTLRMIATGKGDEGVGNLMLELEVTRISDDGATFYFKLPEQEEYQRGGWQYAYRLLENEDGSRRWNALYPGSSFKWYPAGGFKAADFTDSDGDGKLKLRGYLFGPGDTASVPAFAHLRLLQAGLWELRANTPLDLRLAAPAGAAWEVSADGAAYRPKAATAADGMWRLDFSEQEMGAGRLFLRLQIGKRAQVRTEK